MSNPNDGWLKEASAELDTQAPASLEAERSKKTKQQEDSVETKFRRWVVNDRNLAVHVDPSGVPEIYNWTGPRCSPAGGTHWAPMSDDQIEAYAEGYVSSYHPAAYSASKVKSCGWLLEKQLKNLGRVLPDPDPEDCFISTESHLLLVEANGKIRALDHDRKIYARTHVPIRLNPEQVDADGYYTPRPYQEIENGPGLFADFVRGTFPDQEVRDAWRESFGDTLSPVLTQRIAWLLGPGGNGKSQWLGLACALNSNSAAFNLEAQGFDLEDTLGKSFLAIDEVDKGAAGCEKTLKQLFGAEVAKAHRKFKRAVSFRPAFKGMAASNFLPPFAEHSEAIKRRIDPFFIAGQFHDSKTQTYNLAQKIIRGYKRAGADGKVERVESELPLVLDWALSGLLDVQARGRLRMRSEMPEECQRVFREFEREMDPVLRFCEEIEASPGNDLYTSQQIYNAYRQWCIDIGKRPCADSTFWKDVTRFFNQRHGPGSLGKTERPTVKDDTGTSRPNCYRMAIANSPHLRPLHQELTGDTDAVGDPIPSGLYLQRVGCQQ